MFNRTKNNKNRVLVRVCIGCVLPFDAKLIGDGEYNYIGVRGRTTERYYDYEIFEDDLEIFLEVNSTLLIKYQLLDVEKKEDEKDKNSIKPLTGNWIKKDYSKQ